VKLLHGADDIGQVLDDVHGLEAVEAAVGEGYGKRSRSHSTSAALAGLRSIPMAPGLS